jgi:hypothetical protein
MEHLLSGKGKEDATPPETYSADGADYWAFL